ncbi:MAG: hypothetical protein AB1458_05385 [Bacteroidota bacterium]
MKKVVFVLGIIVIISACKKYEEGPVFSLRSKKARVDNTWKIEKYYENGVDLTAAVLSAEDITIDLTKEGKVTWTEVDLQSGSGNTKTGVWEFTDSKKSILVQISGGVSFSGTGSDIWNILRLKNKEFWFTVMNGSDQVEVHLISK